jgi:hypothetical protein
VDIILKMYRCDIFIGYIKVYFGTGVENELELDTLVQCIGRLFVHCVNVIVPIQIN